MNFLIISNKSALIVCKNTDRTSYSGISNRIRDLEHFIDSLGFVVEFLEPGKQINSSYYDLICISSFVNARHLKGLKAKTNYLWIDSMDSWKLTRRSFFFDNPFKEAIKFLRDLAGSRMMKFADLITYCSTRDAEFDGQNQLNILIFSPTQESRQAGLLDFGKRFVFVGPSEYLPNRDGLNYLYSMAEEGIFDKTNLHVYGSQTKYNRSHPKIIIHGEASKTELYGKQDVHLVPIWKGAGIKYKTLMPLSQGIRVISSLEGANGINKTENLKIGVDKKSFKDLVINENWSNQPFKETANLLALDQKAHIAKRIYSKMK